MSEIDQARFIALDRVKDDINRVRDKMINLYNTLDATYDIPSPMPTPQEWTDSQLDALKQASEEVLGQVLTIENSVKRDILLLDKEKLDRL